MPKWLIEGFQADHPTGFSQEVAGHENRVTILLERLAARHLTDSEIIDATFGSRKDLEIHRDKRLGEPVMLMTTGTHYHYVARDADCPVELPRLSEQPVELRRRRWCLDAA
jgi:hypothetical protein